MTVPSAPPRVLVVEDSYLIASMLCAELTHAGFEAMGPASSAVAAMSLIEVRGLPDVGLLDLNLGDHSSEQVLRRLADRGVPTIILTGFGDVAEGLGAQVAAVLDKPVDMVILTRLIGELAGRRPAASGSGA